MYIFHACTYMYTYAGAYNATRRSLFGEVEDVATTMSYTDCDGQENQIANCTGFQYSPYVPRWYCSNDTLAGVMCAGEFTRDYLVY